VLILDGGTYDGLSGFWFFLLILSIVPNFLVYHPHEILLLEQLSLFYLSYATNLHDDLFPRSCLSGTAIVSHLDFGGALSVQVSLHVLGSPEETGSRSDGLTGLRRQCKMTCQEIVRKSGGMYWLLD
jgi:hypothetical protein